MRYETLYSFHDILTLYSPQEMYKIKAKFLYPLACYCVFFWDNFNVYNVVHVEDLIPFVVHAKMST